MLPPSIKVAIIALLGLAVLAAAAAGWLASVRWFYRLRAARPERLTATCSDGWKLAVYFRAAREKKFREPVLLAHGLAANHHYFDLDPPHSLADHLSAAGFDVYSIEWRGTAGSSRPPKGRRRFDYCADDHIRFDAPAFLALALEHSKAERAFWLGHSLGGLVGYGAAQLDPPPKLAGLLALGAPVFFSSGPLLRQAARFGPLLAWPFGLWNRYLSLVFAPWIGWVALPYTDFVLNPKNTPGRVQRVALVHVVSAVGRKMLLQLRDWTWHDVFRSFDGKVDYRAGIARLGLPTMVMAGSKDRLATPENAKKQFELLTAGDKTLVVFGRENADAEDYGHGDLIFGARAPDEVYPVIRRWLEAHASR